MLSYKEFLEDHPELTERDEFGNSFSEAYRREMYKEYCRSAGFAYNDEIANDEDNSY